MRAGQETPIPSGAMLSDRFGGWRAVVRLAFGEEQGR